MLTFNKEKLMSFKCLSLKHLSLKHSCLIVISASLAFVLGCSSEQKGKAIEQGSEVTGAFPNVVNLDQSWTIDTQQAFYFTSQGSRILPYKWFLYLEQAGSEMLFRDNKHISQLRYLPENKTTWNPDGLAVGFVKDVDKKTKQEWMGFNCAACHTAQIEYKGINIRIDGGPTLGDFEEFNKVLVKAMNETYQSEEKFDRFAENVLEKGYSANDKVILRRALLEQTEILAERNQANHPDPKQPAYGYGRVDAIGAIFNQILSKSNNIPNNARASDAPVSYPFLWGTHQSDVVQWTGFAPNGPDSVGALIRNGGEVLGVYGQLTILDDKSVKHYQSSIQIENLGKLEEWVAELRSPMWPSEYLPAIDAVRAAEGEKHYAKYCVNCHQLIKRSDEGEKYTAVLTPQSEVGTDPQEIINMLEIREAGKYAQRKEFVLAGDVIPENTNGLAPLVNAVVGSLLEHPIDTIEAAITEYKGGEAAKQASDGIDENLDHHPRNIFKQKLTVFKNKYKKTPDVSSDKETSSTPSGIDAFKVYKARPLNGIWATAPYLHNGSVPSLYELLLPSDKRSKVFYLGSREFGPVNVGYISTSTLDDAPVFRYDTSLKGNSNEGHEY